MERLPFCGQSLYKGCNVKRGISEVSKAEAEFKSQAVALVSEAKRPAAEVAHELGVKPNTLHTWLSKSQQAVSLSPASAELIAENKRLQRELAQARLERDILKKAAAYFAKGTL